jgi:hypothetical protein
LWFEVSPGNEFKPQHCKKKKKKEFAKDAVKRMRR